MAVAAMPDGQRILSGGNDETVRVWRLNGTLENIFELHTSTCDRSWRCPTTSTRSPPRKTGPQALQRQRRSRPAHLHAPHCQVRCLALLPDGLRFVSGSYDGTACIVEHGPPDLEPVASASSRAMWW